MAMQSGYFLVLDPWARKWILINRSSYRERAQERAREREREQEKERETEREQERGSKREWVREGGRIHGKVVACCWTMNQRQSENCWIVNVFLVPDQPTNGPSQWFRVACTLLMIKSYSTFFRKTRRNCLAQEITWNATTCLRNKFPL